MANLDLPRIAEPPRRPGGWLAPGATLALICAPFLIFLRHNGYPILAPESGMALAVLAGVGLALGWPGRAPGAVGRLWLAGVVALLGLLFVDLQTDVLDEGGWLAGAIAAGVVVFCVLARRQLAPLVCVMGFGMIASTLLLPVDAPRTESAAEVEAPPRADLPTVVHLIVDEHIGVEGIPAEFDRRRQHAERLKHFYTDRGFEVEGGAYAISTTSSVSISNIVNWNLEPPLMDKSKGGAKHERITRNAYFEAMKASGYRIDVHQSDYLDFCSAGPVDACHTYALETIAAIRDAPLPAPEKAKLMLGLYLRLSKRIDDARVAYARFRGRESEAGRDFWPAWNSIGRVSAAAIPPVIEALGEQLKDAQPGTLYFAHLMLPHYPYAFDAECRMRPRAADWLASYEPRHFPMANDPASRALRYPLYLEQVECLQVLLGALFDTMREAGHFDAARIIVHGDHGSRISLAPLMIAADPHIRPSDYLDGFSTLFAHKPPNAAAPGRYGTDLLPVNLLLEWAITDAPVPEALPGEPTVYLKPEQLDDAARPLPRFRGGVPIGEAPDPGREVESGD